MAEREILFRGQTRRKNEWAKMPSSNWVYGGIFVPEDNLNFAIIIAQQENTVEKHSVYGDTVGQYTGLTDKHGIKIFEGDIVEIDHPFEGSFISSVIWDKDCWTLKDFYFACFDYPGMAFSEGTEYMKVIGNIYDNPELLEGENDT